MPSPWWPRWICWREQSKMGQRGQNHEKFTKNESKVHCVRDNKFTITYAETINNVSNGCSRLPRIQMRETTRQTLVVAHTQYFKVSDVYRTLNVNYRHFKLLTIHQIGPRNGGKHSNQTNHTRNWKITRQLLTPCCSLKCLSLSECILQPRPGSTLHGGWSAT
jgi:hypothetical protein